MADDLAWLEAARAGDVRAFERLIEAHQKRIYSLVYRLIGHAEDARDLAQETFLKAFTALPHFRGEASFSTWLCRIATNLCLDHLRRRGPLVSSLDAAADPDTPRPLQLPDPGGGPEEVAEIRERRRLIEEAIASLPPDFRVALVLRDVHGHSYEEIASMTGVELGTVKSRIHRARHLLRHRLAALELLPPARVHRKEGRSL